MKNLSITNYDFPTIVDKKEQGVLRVFEFDNIPFSVKRVFTVVNAKGESTRGQHAHKKCNQLLCCVAGEVLLKCDDGEKLSKKLLTPDSPAFLVPNGIWSEQVYKVNDSVIIVFCDMPYEEYDYIRNYDEFLKWCKNKK